MADEDKAADRYSRFNEAEQQFLKDYLLGETVELRRHAFVSFMAKGKMIFGVSEKIGVPAQQIDLIAADATTILDNYIAKCDMSKEVIEVTKLFAGGLMNLSAHGEGGYEAHKRNTLAAIESNPEQFGRAIIPTRLFTEMDRKLRDYGFEFPERDESRGRKM